MGLTTADRIVLEPDRLCAPASPFGQYQDDVSRKVPLMTDKPAEFDLFAIDLSATEDERRNSSLAQDMVGRAIAWYSQELLREERAAEPDQERVEELDSGLTQAQADRRRIRDLDSQGLERLIDHYAALNRELRAQ